MKLSEIIGLLSKEERKGLDHMFELEEAHYVIKVIDGKRYFVGVNLYQLDHLVPSNKEGLWSCGEMP